MASFVDNTLQDIDSRLRELRDEVSKLEAARTALAGDGGVKRRRARRARTRPETATTGNAATTRPARSTRRRATPRRGGRSSSRATQALDLVRRQPGITTPELAKAMKIHPNYLYRVLPKLDSEGRVKRDGKGWRPAS